MKNIKTLVKSRMHDLRALMNFEIELRRRWAPKTTKAHWLVRLRMLKEMCLGLELSERFSECEFQVLYSGDCGTRVSRGEGGCTRWGSYDLHLVEVEAAGLDRVDCLELAVPVLESRMLHAVHVHLHAHMKWTWSRSHKLIQSMYEFSCIVSSVGVFIGYYCIL